MTHVAIVHSIDLQYRRQLPHRICASPHYLVFMQYDLTWFISPFSAPYFETIALEHGYIRGEVNATSLHIQVQA